MSRTIQKDLVIPLGNGKSVRDGQPVAVHFEIGAVIGGDEKDLNHGHQDDCLQHSGEGVGNHLVTPLSD